MNEQKINISCEGTLNLDILNVKEFQEDIKTIDFKNLEKLKNNIKHSFKAPIFVWKYQDSYYLLDGHQRKKALESLAIEGYEIPLIPAIEVKADSKNEAKKIVLEISSQFGSFDKKELNEYIKKYKIDTLNIELKENTIDICLIDVTKEINIKTEKLKPYKKIHFLISCDIDEVVVVKKAIDSLSKIGGGIEIEEGAN